MAIPGGIFYNTGSLQQRMYPGQQLFTNSLGGPWMTFPPSPPPYCQNCECDGCKIHRERLRLQQEEHAQREKIMEQAIAAAGPIIAKGFDDLIGKQPGSIVQIPAKPKKRSRSAWWAEMAWWTFIGVMIAQFVIWLCTREVG